MASQPSDPPSDRRASARQPIELRVEYKRLNTFFADFTKNLSKGGTFIRTDKPLALGTEFVFALTVPTLADPVRVRGRVVWTIPPDRATEDAPAGMGIEFQWSDDAERGQMAALVERLMREQLGDHLSAKLLGRKPGR